MIFNYLVSQFSIYKINKKNYGAGNPGADILQPEPWIKITQQVMHNPPASTQKHIALVLYGAIHSDVHALQHATCIALPKVAHAPILWQHIATHGIVHIPLQCNTIRVPLGMTGTSLHQPIIVL